MDHIDNEEDLEDILSNTHTSDNSSIIPPPIPQVQTEEEDSIVIPQPIDNREIESLKRYKTLNKELRGKYEIELGKIDAQIEMSEKVLKKVNKTASILENFKRPPNAIVQSTLTQKKDADEYFFVEGSSRPLENDDEKELQPILNLVVNVRHGKDWSSKEVEVLKNEILKVSKAKRTREIVELYRRNDQSGSSQELIQKLKDVSEDRPRENETVIQHLYRLVQDFNMEEWDEVSKARPLKKRNGFECRQFFLIELVPAHWKKRWTKKEDKKILELSVKYSGRNWIQISKELEEYMKEKRHNNEQSAASEIGTEGEEEEEEEEEKDHNSQKYVPYHVFKRYQRSLNPSFIKKKWTETEDKALQKAVLKYGEGNWLPIANALPGRTGQQCLHRWRKSVNPFMKKGKFTLEEDKRLFLAYNVYAHPKNAQVKVNFHPLKKKRGRKTKKKGSDGEESGVSWKVLEAHVPGRTDVQCRERWFNVVDPSVSSGTWSDEEIKKFETSYQKYGAGKWNKISADVGTRTDNQCYRYWRKHYPLDFRKFQVSVTKREKTTKTNFVGRSKEQSTLNQEDFFSVLGNEEQKEILDVAKKRIDQLIKPTTTTTTTTNNDNSQTSSSSTVIVNENNNNNNNAGREEQTIQIPPPPQHVFPPTIPSSSSSSSNIPILNNNNNNNNNNSLPSTHQEQHPIQRQRVPPPPPPPPHAVVLPQIRNVLPSSQHQQHQQLSLMERSWNHSRLSPFLIAHIQRNYLLKAIQQRYPFFSGIEKTKFIEKSIQLMKSSFFEELIQSNVLQNDTMDDIVCPTLCVYPQEFRIPNFPSIPTSKKSFNAIKDIHKFISGYDEYEERRTNNETISQLGENITSTMNVNDHHHQQQQQQEERRITGKKRSRKEIENENEKIEGEPFVKRRKLSKLDFFRFRIGLIPQKFNVEKYKNDEKFRNLMGYFNAMFSRPMLDIMKFNARKGEKQSGLKREEFLETLSSFSN